VGVQCGAAFRKIRAQMKAVANTGRRVGLFLSYFDSLNFLYINFSQRGHDLIYVLEGQATQLGTITPVGSGSVLDNNALDLTATVSSSSVLGTSVEFQSHGLGIGRINLPPEAEVFADSQNPGMVGFCGGDVTEVYGFA